MKLKRTVALIMDDPDAMGAVGKVWVHWLEFTTSPYDGFPDNDDYYYNLLEKQILVKLVMVDLLLLMERHTYIFKAYALDTMLHLKGRFLQTRIRRCNARVILLLKQN